MRTLFKKVYIFTYNSGNRQYLDGCMRLLSINTFTGYPQAEKHTQNLKLLEITTIK
jgi:hypothetical protein